MNKIIEFLLKYIHRKGDFVSKAEGGISFVPINLFVFAVGAAVGLLGQWKKASSLMH